MAAIKSNTANGSNTNIIIMITHLTASSNTLTVGSLPYINSAIYFIGPTSTSIAFISPFNVNFSSFKLSIIVYEDAILLSISLILVSISPVVASA